MGLRAIAISTEDHCIISVDLRDVGNLRFLRLEIFQRNDILSSVVENYASWFTTRRQTFVTIVHRLLIGCLASA